MKTNVHYYLETMCRNHKRNRHPCNHMVEDPHDGLTQTGCVDTLSFKKTKMSRVAFTKVNGTFGQKQQQPLITIYTT